MNVRSELTKLRQQADQVRTDGDVKAISDLMDELSAEAAGGGALRREMTLQEILNASHTPIAADQGCHQKESL